MAQPVIHFYEFGPFRLAPADRLLLRDGRPVQLAPKLFDILAVMVERRGRMLAKDELMQAVWPDSFVEEGNLTRNVSTLRKVLGEGEDGQYYIETVSKRGYRFVAEVREIGNEDAELAVREHIKTHVVIEEEETERRDGETEAKDLSSLSLSPSLPPSLPPSFFSSRLLHWRVLAAGGLLIGLVVGLGYWRKSSRAKQPDLSTEVRSVAVLPFKPLNADNNDEYLGLGLADTLITKLSGLESLIVRPTSAVRKYSSPTQDPLAAGREQQVDAVLDASLQRDGERLRVAVRLLSVRDGKALWTYQCEEVLCNNFFVMQDVISEQVASALMPRLTGEERKRLRKHHTENKEAYQAYAMGLYFWNQRTDEAVRKGIKYFEQAIEKDRNYAMAYVGLADSYIILADYSWCASKECFPKAKLAALKAIALDDELGEAHASLAQILYFYDWNWAEAEREFKRAIELSPGYGYVHQCYGLFFLCLGRFAEAKMELERSLELDPVSLGNNVAYGDLFYNSRDYDQAIAQYQKTLELNPNWSFPHGRLAYTYELKGMYEKAVAERMASALIAGTAESEIEALKNPDARLALRNVRQKAIANNLAALVLRKESSIKYAKSSIKYAIALDYARLGEKEKAFHWLQQACEERGSAIVKLKVEPFFDGLRDDPRFADLLRRVGLAP